MPSDTQFCAVFIDESETSGFVNTLTEKCSICQAEVRVIEESGSVICPECIAQSSAEISMESPLLQNKRTNRSLRGSTSRRNIKRTATTNVKSFQCKYCDMHFESIPLLLKHVEIHSSIGCQIDERVNNETELQHHMKKHGILLASSDQLENLVCNSEVKEEATSFKYSKSNGHHDKLSFTLRVNSKNKLLFQCNFCGLEFNNQAAINSHLLRHLFPSKRESDMKFDSKNVRTFQCSKCSACFINKHLYTKHLNTHREILKCAFCPEKFSTLTAQRMHVQTHHEPKLFQCKYCDERFHQSLSLIQHVQDRHS